MYCIVRLGHGPRLSQRLSLVAPIVIPGRRLSKEPRRIKETVNGRKRLYEIPLCQLSATGKLKWSWMDTETGARRQALKVKAFLHTMFLPVGFPHSVHSVYKSTHIWQFCETTIGSAMSVLCSQAMLSSLGLSASPATSGTTAVAINWVLKDIVGEVLKLGFIQQFAQSFDSHPKSWKLVGEVCSLTGSLMQLSTALVGSKYFLLFAGLGFGLRSIHFSIWGATHMTFTRNFALSGNVGDVVAKDDTQMAVAHLLGTAIGAGLLSLSHSTHVLFMEFMVFAPVHLWATLALLNATRFPVLNQTNLSLLCTEYVKTGLCLTLDEIQPRTRVFNEWPRVDSKGVNVKIGVSVAQAFRGGIGDVSVQDSLEIFKEEMYLVGYSTRKSEFQIVLREGSGAPDVIQAMLCVAHCHSLVSSNQSVNVMDALKKTAEYATTNVEDFVQGIERNGWDVDAVFWGDRGIRSIWPRD